MITKTPLKVELVAITPTIAQMLLDSSKGNRKTRSARVDLYAEQMRKGKWMENGDTIGLYDDGSLQNGHHRMMAVVKSGVTINAILVRGITKEAALTVDKGSPRSASDNILFNRPELGVTMAGILASCSSAILMHDAGVPWNTSGGGRLALVTDEKRIDFIDKNYSEVTEAAGFAVEVVRTGNTMLPKSWVAALYILGARVDKDATAEFLKIVFTGYGVEPGTTADHLRNQLLKCAAKTLQWSMAQKVATAAKCLRSHLMGRNIRHIGNVRVRADEEIARFPTNDGGL